MWKNQGSWNFFHTKLIPNSSIYLEIYLQSNSRFYLIFRVKTAIFVALVRVMYSISYKTVK